MSFNISLVDSDGKSNSLTCNGTEVFEHSLMYKTKVTYEKD